MKKLLLLIALFGLYNISYSQCDRKVTFRCTKARELKNGAGGQEMPLEATLSFDNGKVVFTATMNGETDVVEGEITEVVACQWTEYLKNGRTQYKAYMKKPNVSAENAIIDISSENGITKIICGSDPDTGSQLELEVSDYTLAEAPAAPAKSQPAEKAKKNKKKAKATR